MLLGLVAIFGWIFLDYMKIKNGYPLSDDDGNLIHKSNPEDLQEIKQLTAENRDLMNRLEKISERVETLERIATDKPARLAAEIDALSDLSSDLSKEKAK
ncbi:hypothetical protein [Sphingomicrobium marinum]|uniref:hypothetical protein n=1 Tax=Sphingomicrobium marinum TaxID=1227950 RepID=UPI00223F5AAD|nr:hypothetical protein [Sphingomicrobium marinum]